MTMSIRKRFVLFGAAIFVLGTATGSLIVYHHQGRQSGIQHVEATTLPQQPKPQTSATMAGMEGTSTPANTGSADAAPKNTMVPGTVTLNPASQQLIGVRYTEARRADMKRTLRTVGIVQMDDEKISRVHVKIAGWIEKVYLDYMGKLIKKGEPLFTLYSPDLVSTEQE